MSPTVGQAAACPYARPSSRRSSSPRSPPGLFPPMGGREVFGRPIVMINEMIKLQRSDEEVTAQRTVVEQQAEAEARAGKRELWNNSWKPRLDTRQIYHNKPGLPCTITTWKRRPTMKHVSTT